MCAAIGLCVEADDVGDPHFSQVGGEQVGRRADDVRDREGFVTRQDLDVDAPIGGDLLPACLRDPVSEALGDLGQVEVHPAFERLHVATGYQTAVLPEDDAGQEMQRGMRAHQCCTPLVV